MWTGGAIADRFLAMANGSAALRTLHHQIAELLDKVAVRTEAGFEVGGALRKLEEDWRTGSGSEEGTALLRRAQGTVGMINSAGGDPLAMNHAIRGLLDLKLECRIKAADR